MLLLLDVGLGYFLNNIVFVILDWFNRLNIFFKIFILLVGGGVLLGMLFGLVGGVAKIISHFIFKYFPLNWFTLVSSLVLSITNTIFNIIGLWRIPESYNFWVVIELIMLSLFVWSLNSIVIGKNDNED